MIQFQMWNQNRSFIFSIKKISAEVNIILKSRDKVKFSFSSLWQTLKAAYDFDFIFLYYLCFQLFAILWKYWASNKSFNSPLSLLQFRGKTTLKCFSEYFQHSKLIIHKIIGIDRQAQFSYSLSESCH